MIERLWNAVVWSFRSFPELWSVTVISAAFTTGILLAGRNGWEGVENCTTDGENWEGYCFCEQESDGLVRQPINAWSNLTFVCAGMIIGWDAGRRRLKKKKDGDDEAGAPREYMYINIMTGTIYYPILYSSVLASVGPASIALHASLKAWGGRVDMAFVIALLTLVFSVSLGRLLGPRFLKIPLFTVMFSVLTIITQVMIALAPRSNVDTSFYLFIVLGVCSVVMEALHLCCHKIRICKLLYVAAVVILFTAGAFRYIDEDNKLCNPASFFQPHAMWHFLAALSGLLLYFYICTERPPLKEAQKIEDNYKEENTSHTHGMVDSFNDEESVYPAGGMSNSNATSQ